MGAIERLDFCDSSCNVRSIVIFELDEEPVVPAGVDSEEFYANLRVKQTINAIAECLMENNPTGITGILDSFRLETGHEVLPDGTSFTPAQEKTFDTAARMITNILNPRNMTKIKALKNSHVTVPVMLKNQPLADKKLIVEGIAVSLFNNRPIRIVSFLDSYRMAIGKKVISLESDNYTTFTPAQIKELSAAARMITNVLHP